MNSHRAPSFRRCSFDCMLRSRTHFCRVRYQSLTHTGNAPGTPCKAGCFSLYRVIRARLFRIRSALCGDKPSAERTRPQGCISAPFVPKGFILRSRLRLVFSKTPALVHSSRQAGEVLWLPRRSCSLLPAQYFQRLRPGR